MRRGQSPREVFDEGQSFTKQELLEASGLSSKTFDMIRKAARIKGPPHGGLNWKFPRADVETLIEVAGGGRFTERGGPAVTGWRKMLDAPVGKDAEDQDEQEQDD